MKPCKADENEHFHNKFIRMMAIVYAKSVTFARNIEKCVVHRSECLFPRMEPRSLRKPLGRSNPCFLRHPHTIFITLKQKVYKDMWTGLMSN